MITDLILKNHECHKNTHFKFAPGLNVFVGDTSAGKSSVFRAMYWLMNNRPSNDSMFPLYWQGTTEVEARFINPEVIVARLKDKKNWNHYTVNDREPINAGAKGPPDPVPSLLLMDDVNFQAQIDRAYLMFDTPGERGRVLNKIAGLDDIDRTNANAKSDISKLKQAIETEKANLEGYSKQLEQYETLPDQEKALELCERLDGQIIRSRKKTTKLKSLIGQIEDINEQIETISKPLKYEAEIQRLKTLCGAISESSGRVSRVRGLLLKLDENRKALDDIKDYSKAEIILAELNGKIQEISKKSEKIKKLKNEITQYLLIEKKMQDLTASIAELEKDLPKRCDFCNGTGYITGG